MSEPFTTKTYEAVTYEQDATLNNSYSEVSFDRFIAYNDLQSTGLQKLVPADIFGSNAPSTSVSLLKKKDRYFRINEIRDLSTNTLPALVDNIPNTAKVNYNKSLFNTERMIDYYLNLRLYFNPTSNVKLSTDLVSITSQQTSL